MVKYLPANAGDTRDAGSISGSGRSLGVGKVQPTTISLPEKFHGQRSLVGHKELDTTKVLSTHTQNSEMDQHV